MPAAWSLGHLTIGQLYLVALVAGVATVFFDVAYQSYLPSLVAADQVVDGNAKLQASQSVAQVAGPAVGGALLRAVAAPVLIGLDAVSYALSALVVRRIRHGETPPARDGRRPLRAEIGEGLRFVVRNPLLLRICACVSASNLCSSMVQALFVLYVLRVLHLGVETVGLVYALAAIGGLAGALVTSRVVRVVGEGRTIPVSAVVMGGFAVLTPLAAGLADLVPPAVVLVVGAVVVWACHGRLQRDAGQLPAAALPAGAPRPDERDGPVPRLGRHAHRRPARRRPRRDPGHRPHALDRRSRPARRRAAGRAVAAVTDARPSRSARDHRLLATGRGRPVRARVLRQRRRPGRLCSEPQTRPRWRPRSMLRGIRRLPAPRRVTSSRGGERRLA